MMKKPFPCPSFETQTYERLLQKEPDTRTAPNCKHHPDTNLWTCFSKSRSWWTTSCGRIIRPERNLGFTPKQIAGLNRKPVYICWPGNHVVDAQIQWNASKFVSSRPGPAFGSSERAPDPAELWLTPAERASLMDKPLPEPEEEEEDTKEPKSKTKKKSLTYTEPESRYTMPNDTFRDLCSRIAADLEEWVLSNPTHNKIPRPGKVNKAFGKELKGFAHANHIRMTTPFEIDKSSMGEMVRKQSPEPRPLIDRVDHNQPSTDTEKWDGLAADPAVNWQFIKQNLPTLPLELNDLFEGFPTKVAKVLRFMVLDNMNMREVAEMKDFSLDEVYQALGIAADLVVERRKAL